MGAYELMMQGIETRNAEAEQLAALHLTLHVQEMQRRGVLPKVLKLSPFVVEPMDPEERPRRTPERPTEPQPV